MPYPGQQEAVRDEQVTTAFNSSNSEGRGYTKEQRSLQADALDSVIRVRDQMSQELPSGLGAPITGTDSAAQAAGRHKDILAGLKLHSQTTPGPTSQHGAASRAPGPGASIQGAGQQTKAGVVPQTFTAPSASAQRTAPSIVVPRAGSQPASLAPSTNTTPRGTGISTNSTPSGAAASVPPTGAAPWTGGSSGGSSNGTAPAAILAKANAPPPVGAPGAPASTKHAANGGIATGVVAPRTGNSGLGPSGPGAVGGMPASTSSAQAMGAAGVRSAPGGAPQGRPTAPGTTPQQQQQQLTAQQQLAARAAQQQMPHPQHASQQQQAWAGSQAQTPPPPAQQQGTTQPGQQQQHFSALHSAANNPIFGSQDAPSPLFLARRESYVPTSAETLATASRTQQHRGNGISAGGLRGPGALGSGHPTPAIAQPGDLFNPDAVRTAVARRPTELQYLCELPAWMHQRPSLSGLDLIAAAGSTLPSGSVAPDAADVTPQELMVSERAVVSDLLSAFLGLTSQLVRPVLMPPAGTAAAAGTGPCLTFTVREELVHETLRERVAPLLPICDYVAVIQRFVETRSMHCYGKVTHALAAALRSYLEDWQMMVAMMENQMLRGALDLTRLTFFCQQPAAALAVLADVAAQAANVERTSAGLLNLLHARYSACAGNGPGRSLLHHLLVAAAAPYCACLESWLRQGVLDDPYHEFMVQEDQSLRRDSPAAATGPAAAAAAASRASAYWRGRYTLRYVPQPESRAVASPRSAAPSPAAPASLDVPIFMFPCRELILRTGKYQNVLRECGQPVAQPLMPQSAAAAAAGAPPAPLPPLSYDPTQPGSLQQHIRAAHAAASSALLGFLLRGGGGGGGGVGAGGRGSGAGLLAVLRSIKHFFLLDQGDVLVSIMEVADEELCKPAKAINRTRLQSLLEMAVKMSSAAADPHADSLGFEMDPRPLESLVKAAALAAAAAGSPAGPDGGAATSLPGAPDSPYGTPTPRGGVRGVGTGGRPLTHTPGGSRLLGPRDQDLPGWELFLPTLKLDWPATLVVGGEELLQYQLLFKHLWGLKRAERQLEATWLLLQGTKRLAKAGVALPPQAAARRQKQMAVAHALCHQLHFTVQELIRYGTLDVLEPLWNCLEEGVMQRAADVDQVIELHRDFLRRAVSGLLLNQSRALRCMMVLQQSAAGFARHVSALWDRLQAGVETASKATQVTAADIAAEQQRAAQLAAALDDLQRLMGEATAQVQALVAAVRDHYERLMTGGIASGATTGSSGAVLGAGGNGPAGGAAAELSELGGWDLEALQNLADRLDFGRPAAGTLGAVLAEMVRG